VPSEAWVSSFIGHDDNFGSNFCVPRLYVTPEQVDYVVALLPEKVRYCGVVAEAIAANYLYSVLPELSVPQKPWLERLIASARRQDVVLRALSLPKDQYIHHLRDASDWDYKREKASICNALEKHLPPHPMDDRGFSPRAFSLKPTQAGRDRLGCSHQAKHAT
jgi:hypothetical protein